MPTPIDSQDDDFILPDGTILTPDRAAEAGQKAIDDALSSRRTAA